MPKLIAPLDKAFTIIVESKHPEKRVTEADPIIVSFRQATEALNLRRQEILARPINRSWEDEKYHEEFVLTPFGRRMALDVWLTLTSCNIETTDGKRLFAFSELNGSNKIVDKSLDEFLKRWGQLWPEWCEAIYEKCLEVNPSWGFGGEAENEDEEALTLGEEPAAEAATKSQPDLVSA